MRIPSYLLYRSPVLSLFSFLILLWSLSFTTYFLGTFFWTKGQAVAHHRQLTLSIEATVLTGHLAGDAFLVIVGFISGLRIFGVEKAEPVVSSSSSLSSSASQSSSSSTSTNDANDTDKKNDDDNGNTVDNEQTLTISQRMIRYINLRWFLTRFLYHTVSPYYLIYLVGCILSFLSCHSVNALASHKPDPNLLTALDGTTPLATSPFETSTSPYVPGLQGFRNTTETITTTYPVLSSSLLLSPSMLYLRDVLFTLTTELHYEDQCSTGPHLWPLALAIRYQVYFLFLTFFSVIGCSFASYLMIMCTSCATRVCVHQVGSSSSSSTLLPSDRRTIPSPPDNGICQTCTHSIPRSYVLIRRIINYFFTSPDHTILLGVGCSISYSLVWRIYYAPPLVSNSLRYIASSIGNAYYDYYFTHGVAHLSSYGWGILSSYACLRWGYGYHTTIENRLLWAIVTIVAVLGYGYDISIWITLLPSSYVYTGLTRKLSVWYYVSQTLLGLYGPIYSGSFATLLFFCYRSSSLNRYLLAPSFTTFMLKRDPSPTHISIFTRLLYFIGAFLHPVFRILLLRILPFLRSYVPLIYITYPLIGYGVFVYFPPATDYSFLFMVRLMVKVWIIVLPTVYFMRSIAQSFLVRTMYRSIGKVLYSIGYTLMLQKLINCLPERMQAVCNYRLFYLIYVGKVCTDILQNHNPSSHHPSIDVAQTSISLTNDSVDSFDTIEENDDHDAWIWGKDWEIMELPNKVTKSSLRNRRNPTNLSSSLRSNVPENPILPSTTTTNATTTITTGITDSVTQGNDKFVNTNDNDDQPVRIVDEEDYDDNDNREMDMIFVDGIDEHENNEDDEANDDDDGDNDDETDEEDSDDDDTGFAGLSRKDEQRAQRVAALIIARIRRDTLEFTEQIQERLITANPATTTNALSNLNSEVEKYLQQTVPDPLLDRTYDRTSRTVNYVSTGITSTVVTIKNGLYGLGTRLFRTKADRYADERNRDGKNPNARTLHSDGAPMRWRRNASTETSTNTTGNPETVEQAEITMPGSTEASIPPPTDASSDKKDTEEMNDNKYGKYLDISQRTGLQYIMEWSERNNIRDDIVLYVIQLVSDGLRSVTEELQNTS